MEKAGKAFAEYPMGIFDIAFSGTVPEPRRHLTLLNYSLKPAWLGNAPTDGHKEYSAHIKLQKLFPSFFQSYWLDTSVGKRDT